MDVSFVRLVDGAVGAFRFEDRLVMGDTLYTEREGLLWVHGGDDEEPAPRLFVEYSRIVEGGLRV